MYSFQSQPYYVLLGMLLLLFSLSIPSVCVCVDVVVAAVGYETKTSLMLSNHSST